MSELLCAVCEYLGHRCEADGTVAGKSGLGICSACRALRKCDWGGRGAVAGKFYITEQECACGCGTRMGSAVVERGWKYLRGHKPRGAPGASPVASARRSPAPWPGPVTAIGIQQVRQFLEESARFAAREMEISGEHLERLRSELAAAEAVHGRLAGEHAKYVVVLKTLGFA